MLENRSSGVKYTFPCNKWLADDEGDRAVERELEPSDKSDGKLVIYGQHKINKLNNFCLHVNFIIQLFDTFLPCCC